MSSPGEGTDCKADEVVVTTNGDSVPEIKVNVEDIATAVTNSDAEHAQHQESSSAPKKKKTRPRKRKLYADVCRQIEFYFSDANISKNRMMEQLVITSEYVNLNTFLGFNKIQKLLPEVNVNYIQKSLASSNILELSPDLLGVKRKAPYDPAKLKSTEDVEQCTIYVENVPSHVDHDWLEKIFQEFGPIAYVAMPKFKHNGLPKGFAFIEFKEKEGADHCLNAYGDIGGCLPETLNPENLLSVKTFESNDSSSPTHSVKENQVSCSSSGGPKREHSDSDDPEDSDYIPRKKIKAEFEEPEASPSNSSSQSPHDIADPKDLNINSTENGEDSCHATCEKKKRRRVNKTKKLDNIEKGESDSIQLKILPKRNWRQLRNRYLNLQRENLGKLKRQLQYQNRDRNYKNAEEEQGIEKKAKSTIVKIEFHAPYEDSDSLRLMLEGILPGENSSLLLFVDYSNPNLYAHVRLDGNPEYFQEVGEFLNKASKVFQSAVVLNEVQTKEFWNEVRTKIKSDPKKKIRGRDKLLQQAMKTATHIRFADED